MIKKTLKYFSILSAIVLTGFIIFIFNSEKFLSDYWFQTRIDDFSCIEPLENLEIEKPELKYNVYDNSGIDLEISIFKNGVVSIGRHEWFSNNEDRKKHYFITDKKNTDRIFNNFNRIYSKSKITSVDDHLSARYYRFMKTDTLNGLDVEIGFYNAQPDKYFKRLKKDFLEIGNQVIDELEK